MGYQNSFRAISYAHAYHLTAIPSFKHMYKWAIRESIAILKNHFASHHNEMLFNGAYTWSAQS